MKEALFWRREGERIRCQLCPHACLISQGQRGRCQGRENRDGRLAAVNFGRISSYAVDPIEKKPLYHFLPGCTVLSVGTVGCNFSCSFCQNWRISQLEADTWYLSPEELVRAAVGLAAEEPRLVGIAYTYSEPLVWFEYVKETALLARKQGLVNILVTNGFVNPEPLRELLPLLDAVNLDLKAAGDSFYRRYCGGNARIPRQTAKLLSGSCHLELTCLLIPGANDKLEEVLRLADWISRELGSDVPLHLSRYFPSFKLKNPPTPETTMRQAQAIAKRKLHYVYLGNMGPEDTYCGHCGKLVISRQGRVKVNLPAGRCPACGRKLPIASMK